MIFASQHSLRECVTCCRAKSEERSFLDILRCKTLTLSSTISTDSHVMIVGGWYDDTTLLSQPRREAVNA